MTLPGALRGLYAITSSELCVDGPHLLICVEAALRGGARLLQYRDKHNSPALRRSQAAVLVGLCHHFGAALIVNDDPVLAAEIGADGVHLGRSDPSISHARAVLGPDALIGVSCGPSLVHARPVAAAGASYVAFGRFFPSQTKPNAPQARLELLAEAKQQLDIPVCAIGGITTANAVDVISAGADLIAAVEGVFGSNDAATVEAAARAYTGLFKA